MDVSVHRAKDMDTFVSKILSEWGLKDYIKIFQENKVDRNRLLSLEEHEIIQLIDKAGPRAKLKMHLKKLKVSPFTFMHDKDDAFCVKDDVILKDVKEIMTNVETKLREDTKLGRFLRNTFFNWKVDKRHVVGVIGQTGAGKSSLINAVIGEKDLLPTGNLTACTTAMIKLEGSQNNTYEAEIEFIPKTEWEDRLWSVKNLYTDKNNYENEEDDDEDYKDTVEKLTAFYGDNWKNESFKMLMDPKYFTEIPEFLSCHTKKVQCTSAKELREKTVRYTSQKEDERSFWPLVKCVTLRVPDNNLLKHVTLVDLPGNGDKNKSRDQMWKQVIGSCSTLWIVTAMTRAASERYAWDILTSLCDLMKNSGISWLCIHFICTKTDNFTDKRPDTDERQYILSQNQDAKLQVKKEIKTKKQLKTLLQRDFFEVFTVSSQEFLESKYLQLNDTEIPELRIFLQCLNELHGQTLNYVTQARAILSLMKEASAGDVVQQQIHLRTKLDEIIKSKLSQVKTKMHEACMTLDKCLTKDVTDFCQRVLKQHIQHTSCTALKCGSKCGEIFNLISTFLITIINEEFKKVFPIDGQSGHFYGVIHEFSLGTLQLVQKHKALELQLMFLRTEEEKIKKRIIQILQNRKTIIYYSLMQTVEETKQECYKEEANFSSKGCLEKMRHTFETYVQKAKDIVLQQHEKLMEDVLRIMEGTLHESVELSLTVRNMSMPDISTEYKAVVEHYNALMSSIDGEDDLLLSDSDMEIS